mgnify:CR=1 FL=1
MATTRDAVDDLSPAEIREILIFGYGLTAETIDIVSGELATVARVRTQDKDLAVKALPGTESDGAVVEWQVHGMQVLQSHELPVPAITSTRDGDAVHRAHLNGRDIFSVVTDWVNDPALADVEVQEPLLYEIGELAARVNIALTNFAPAPTHISHEWEFARAGETLRQFIPRIPDAHIREIAEHMANRHDTAVVPLLSTLPQSVLHQDLHDSNLLIGTDSHGKQFISGILDFGDMMHGPRIAELVVAAAYASRHYPDPLHAITRVVTGWRNMRDITEQEMDVLWTGIVSRLALNVSIWSARTTGPRGSYAQARLQGTMPTLEKLLEVDQSEVRQILA